MLKGGYNGGCVACSTEAASHHVQSLCHVNISHLNVSRTSISFCTVTLLSSLTHKSIAIPPQCSYGCG